MVSLLLFIMATMRIVFGQKIPLDRKGSFGGNVFSKSAKKYKDKNTDCSTISISRKTSQKTVAYS